MIKLKLVSSLEKVFLDESIDDFKALTHISGLRGERISLQLLASYVPTSTDLWAVVFSVEFSGSLAKYAKIRNVRHMGVTKPTTHGHNEFLPGYLRTAPGVYPDLLEEAIYGGKFVLQRMSTESFWIDVEIPEGEELVGENDLTVTVKGADRKKDKFSFEQALHCGVEVINARLPEQELIMTQWFYCDTLAEYYGVPVWSEEHWRIIEEFAKMAVKHGQNMILTPVFTPELDTYVGGERLTNQLVRIEKNGDEYSFDFTLLDRWVDMCDRIGMKYFEISHLFSQWGATHAPKIIVTEGGVEKKMFGWETDAHGKEYGDFLRSFLKALLSHMKKNGNDKRCFFHISDEPNSAQLEDYKRSQAQVADILEGYTIMDAMSHFEYYSEGVMRTPIPKTGSMKPFIEAGVKDMWTYYCGAAGNGCSSRMLAMPAARNRALGMQLYKYNIDYQMNL